ncbi:hypothetical protein B0H11DRAFT_1921841 [Mycena galericulata]|nr:hypothetical protein B0H11DRAFT_1921841 [Mycena galericulata]
MKVALAGILFLGPPKAGRHSPISQTGWPGARSFLKLLSLPRSFDNGLIYKSLRGLKPERRDSGLEGEGQGTAELEKKRDIVEEGGKEERSYISQHGFLTGAEELWAMLVAPYSYKCDKLPKDAENQMEVLLGAAQAGRGVYGTGFATGTFWELLYRAPGNLLDYVNSATSIKYSVVVRFVSLSLALPSFFFVVILCLRREKGEEEEEGKLLHTGFCAGEGASMVSAWAWSSLAGARVAACVQLRAPARADPARGRGDGGDG